NGEVWETLIASSPYTDNIRRLIEYVIYNSFRLEGVYFLALEFEHIISALVAEKGFTEYGNHFQIFVTITEASGIRVSTKYKKNILDDTYVQFPADKSDLYILGVIDNVIEDKLIKYKSYI